MGRFWSVTSYSYVFLRTSFSYVCFLFSPIADCSSWTSPEMLACLAVCVVYFSASAIRLARLSEAWSARMSLGTGLFGSVDVTDHQVCITFLCLFGGWFALGFLLFTFAIYVLFFFKKKKTAKYIFFKKNLKKEPPLCKSKNERNVAFDFCRFCSKKREICFCFWLKLI